MGRLRTLPLADLALVRTVLDPLSAAKLAFMEQVIGLPRALGVWAPDDMGHKPATMVSPDLLRTYHPLPRYSQMAALAHRRDHPN